MKCRCSLCRFTDKVLRVKAKLSRPDQVVIEDLIDRYLNESMDADYWKLNFLGKWPTQIEERSDLAGNMIIQTVTDNMTTPQKERP